MLTPSQKPIFEYIKKYLKKKGYSPSLEEVGKRFKLAKSTIHQHVEELKEKGYLDKSDYRARSIELAKNRKKSDLIKIPLLGTIAAGEPIEAIEDRKTIEVPKSQLAKSGEHYALRVQGNSMIDEGIFDGDTVIIREQPTVENGETVVALLNDNEVTLKKIYKERGGFRLQPANSNLKPFFTKELIIQGKVVNIIRNFEEVENDSEVTESKKLINKKATEIYKKLPEKKIICGDALDELKKLPDKSCDIIIADPPYNIGKDFGNNHDDLELSEYLAWCKQWIDDCIRIMKPTATMFIYGFSEILAFLSVRIPLKKRWLIWHYTNKNVASFNFWQRSHEAILCCWKDKRIFNRDEVREPYTEGFLNGAAGKIRRGTPGRFSSGAKETIYVAHKNGALPRDVIKIAALAGGAGMSERWFLCKTCNDVFAPTELKKHKNHEILKHPTQKPLELSRKLIASSMPKKGGVVLIPFVGTGSECIAAKELGQSYVGFELNPDYIKIAEKWLANTRYINRLF